MRGQGILELSEETRKKERKKEERNLDKWLFFEYLVLACTIELMDDLGLVRWIICWRFCFTYLEISQNYLFCMEAEKGTPKLRRSRSEVSPNTVLPRFAEVISEASLKSPPKLRRCFSKLSSDTSPKSPPKLRRSFQVDILLY